MKHRKIVALVLTILLLTTLCCTSALAAGGEDQLSSASGSAQQHSYDVPTVSRFHIHNDSGAKNVGRISKNLPTFFDYFFRDS